MLFILTILCLTSGYIALSLFQFTPESMFFIGYFSGFLNLFFVILHKARKMTNANNKQDE